MQIQSVQNPIMGNKNQPQFKAAYPVVYWIVETNKKCAPTASYKLTQKLQSLLVRMLNGSNKVGKSKTAETIRKIIKETDNDVKNFNEVRSYYNYKKTNKNTYQPIAYLVTGKDASIFDEEYGKPIGRAKRDFAYNSAELLQALQDYSLLGLNFVKKPFRNIRGKSNPKDTMELHVIFETQRNSKGKRNNYKIIERDGIPKCKFFEKNSPENPLVKKGYRKI